VPFGVRRCIVVWVATRRFERRTEGRVRLKRDGTLAETRFRLSPKRTSPFKSAGRQFSRLLAAKLCASAVVMLETPRSEVVWEYWLSTPFVSFPFTSPPCVTVCHQVSNALYLNVIKVKYSQWCYQGNILCVNDCRLFALNDNCRMLFLKVCKEKFMLIKPQSGKFSVLFLGQSMVFHP